MGNTFDFFTHVFGIWVIGTKKARSFAKLRMTELSQLTMDN